MLSDSSWTLGVRVAGALHFITLTLACFTPIPPDWEKNLDALPEVHRRFAIAQNFFIGATIAFLGAVSVLFAPALLTGAPLARVLCAATALWWGGRLAILPWLQAHRHLKTATLRAGFYCLLAECAMFFAGYGYLAIRPA